MSEADIAGQCADRFAGVRRAFERNFAEHGEVGASICVTLDGDTVVDLWGGTADLERGAAWERDTIGVVWSCTKGAVALCAHVLVANGAVDLDAPIAHYWPDFAQHGKDGVTVRMALAHQAGLPAFREPMPDDGYLDWDYTCGRLAYEAPFWEPGTRHGYHALTFGHLVGEIVRRVDGRSVGAFFRDEIATPLGGLDVWIGLPAEHEARVAPTIPAAPSADTPLPGFYATALSDPASVAACVLMHSGAVFVPGWIDERATHAAELPAFGGIANARGLAHLYRPLALGGSADGVVLASRDSIAAMGAVASANSVDATLLAPTRWALGFVKSVDNRAPHAREPDGVVLSEDAFGHVGMGGSVGFCDPIARLSFGYTMNRQGLTTGLDVRGQSLVDETYAALGYARPVRGSWYY